MLAGVVTASPTRNGDALTPSSGTDVVDARLKCTLRIVGDTCETGSGISAGCMLHSQSACDPCVVHDTVRIATASATDVPGGTSTSQETDVPLSWGSAMVLAVDKVLRNGGVARSVAMRKMAFAASRRSRAVTTAFIPDRNASCEFSASTAAAAVATSIAASSARSATTRASALATARDTAAIAARLSANDSSSAYRVPMGTWIIVEYRGLSYDKYSNFETAAHLDTSSKDFLGGPSGTLVVAQS